MLEDLVVNHVHQEHEYVKRASGLDFHSGCVCGNEQLRLDGPSSGLRLCDFHLPDVDWTNPSIADQQFDDDALW